MNAICENGITRCVEFKIAANWESQVNAGFDNV